MSGTHSSADPAGCILCSPKREILKNLTIMTPGHSQGRTAIAVREKKT